MSEQLKPGDPVEMAVKAKAELSCVPTHGIVIETFPDTPKYIKIMRGTSPETWRKSLWKRKKVEPAK